MLFFFLLLILDCGVSALLAYLLLRTARNSLSYRVRRAFLYPAPVAATILLIVFSMVFTIPRVLDAERLVLGGLVPQNVTVERVSGWNSVIVDGRRLSYAPWGLKPVEGGAYRMTIAPRSRTILKMEPVSASTK